MAFRKRLPPEVRLNSHITVEIGVSSRRGNGLEGQNVRLKMVRSFDYEAPAELSDPQPQG